MSEHSNLIGSQSFTNGHDVQSPGDGETEEVKEFKPIPGARRSRSPCKPYSGNLDFQLEYLSRWMLSNI